MRQPLRLRRRLEQGRRRRRRRDVIPRLQDFTGRWSLARRIDDRRTGQAGVFTGEAVFAPNTDGLIYRETGELTLGAASPMKASRSYIWRQAGEDLIAVLFDDGRPFHEFRPHEARPVAGHDCAPDRYDVAYDFTAWPQWRSAWTVSGPRKDYEMQSLYTFLR